MSTRSAHRKPKDRRRSWADAYLTTSTGSPVLRSRLVVRLTTMPAFSPILRDGLGNCVGVNRRLNGENGAVPLRGGDRQEHVAPLGGNRPEGFAVVLLQRGRNAATSGRPPTSQRKADRRPGPNRRPRIPATASRCSKAPSGRLSRKRPLPRPLRLARGRVPCRPASACQHNGRRRVQHGLKLLFGNRPALHRLLILGPRHRGEVGDRGKYPVRTAQAREARKWAK